MTQEEELKALLKAAWYGDAAALNAMTDKLLELIQEAPGDGIGRPFNIRHRYHERFAANVLEFLVVYGSVSNDGRILTRIRDSWVWLTGGQYFLPEEFAEKFPNWFLRKVNDHKDRIMRKAIRNAMLRAHTETMAFGNAARISLRDIAEQYLGTPDFETVINSAWLKEDRREEDLPEELRR